MTGGTIDYERWYPEVPAVLDTKQLAVLLHTNEQIVRAGVRHTHAALLIAQREHPEVIQTRLGHASIRTTLDIYGHLFEGLGWDVADRLDEAAAPSPRPERALSSSPSTPHSENPRKHGGFLVGARGFEPLTSSASGKRSPPELSARAGKYTPAPAGPPRGDDRNRTGVPGFADPCLNHSATSPHLTAGSNSRRPTGAEDGARTRDLNLGKVALYQLSYFRVGR